MNHVALLGGYAVACLAVLLVAAHRLLKNDPALRDQEFPCTRRMGPPRPD